MRNAEFGVREKDSLQIKENHLPPSAFRTPPPLSNGTLGMMLFVGSLTVLFSCFISAYLVLRSAAESWPPGGTPLLSLGLSSANTLVLIASSFFAARAFLRTTFGLGTLFVFLQGVEFYRLYGQGLTLQSGSYGAVFYSLISLHALHVVGGLGYWLYLLWVSPTQRPARVSVAKIYWYFVTLVWLILFGILYIL